MGSAGRCLAAAQDNKLALSSRGYVSALCVSISKDMLLKLIILLGDLGLYVAEKCYGYAERLLTSEGETLLTSVHLAASARQGAGVPPADPPAGVRDSVMYIYTYKPKKQRSPNLACR